MLMRQQESAGGCDVHSRAPTVALIGSFRKHYAEVCAAKAVFDRASVTVTTPAGAEIIENDIEFVRFTADPATWDDPMVQTMALHRILRADAVYVVAPEGYVGRTTCYEIGRCMQAGLPLYFSQRPQDLPLRVPDTHVVPADVLAAYILEEAVTPLLASADAEHASLERRLLDGDYELA